MKVLVDTSAWIDHFHKPVPEIAAAIDDEGVLVHPFVIGEIAMGRHKKRAEVLRDLNDLEFVPKADDEEVLALVDRHQIFGCGIGWVDAHLIAAARIAGVELFTRDLALKRVWTRINAPG